MTIYLKFPSQQIAIDALAAADYVISEYNDHLQGNGWGVLMPHPNGNGEHLVNIYDCETLHADLVQYQTPQPLTPYNIRAGDDLQLVFRTVIVTAAIRDTARAMVVAMAGDTHAQMWSQGLSADGQAPATHYINSGLVRVELAAMLSDAQLLADGTGLPLQQAQYILGQCEVTDKTQMEAELVAGLQAAE